MRSQLLAHELGTVIPSLRDLYQAIRNRIWEKAAHFCEESQVRLSRNTRDNDFTLEETARNHTVSDDLKVINHQINQIRSQKQKERQVPQDACNKLSDAITELSRIEGRLRSASPKELET